MTTDRSTEMPKYPARLHAQKVIAELVKLLPEEEKGKMHAILLQAAPVENRHDTDRELPFHQEANFTYLTGYPHPAATVLVCFGVQNGSVNTHHHLFVPPAVPEETMWSAAPPTLEEARDSFDSDNIVSTAELSNVLADSAKCSNNELTLHTLPSTMEYPALPANASHKALEKLKVTQSTEHLLEALHIARLTKTPFEIDLMREANRISSNAHEVLMRTLGLHAQARKEGGKGEKMERTGRELLAEWEVEGETDAEAVFVAACRRQGASQAYLPICASGSRAATLHYVCNDRVFPSVPRKTGNNTFARPLQSGCCSPDQRHAYTAGTPVGEYHSDAFEPQVLLVDAGGEWQNYAADITRTLPVGNGGRYTKEGGEIYELVLRMQKECEAMMKPGVHWDTIHLHGHKVLIEGFIDLGIFRSPSHLSDSGEDTGDTNASASTPTSQAQDRSALAEIVLQSGITAAFFPHGLGHSLGLDVHDSRQYLKSTLLDLPPSTENTPAKLYAYLRIRQPLLENMVLTVEPGCYFPQQLMQLHGVWESEYVDQEVLRRYVGVGGVRIEDAVLVTREGSENLTRVPRERAEVEALCSGTA